MKILLLIILLLIISCQTEEKLPLKISPGYYWSINSQELIIASDKKNAQFKVFNDSKGVFEYGAGSFMVRKIISDATISTDKLYQFEFFIVSNRIHTKDSVEKSNWYFNPIKKEIYKVPKNPPFSITVFKNKESIDDVSLQKIIKL